MECFRIIAEKITERASKQKSPVSIIHEILQKLPSVLDKKPSWYITEDGDGKFRGTFKLVHLDQRIFCESHCLVGDKGDASLYDFNSFGLKVHNFVGKTSIQELITLIYDSKNNTSDMVSR